MAELGFEIQPMGGSEMMPSVTVVIEHIPDPFCHPIPPLCFDSQPPLCAFSFCILPATANTSSWGAVIDPAAGIIAYLLGK